MRKTLIGLLTASLVLGAAMAQAQVRWVNSFDQAMSISKSTGKLVMVDFYTDWCGFCKKLVKETFPDPYVIRLSSQFVPIALDAEKGGVDVAKKYKIGGYPRVLFLNSDGEVVYRISGFKPAAEFAVQMENAILASQLPAIEADFKKDPNDATALAKLVRVYIGKGDQKKAPSHLEKLEALKPSPTIMAPIYNAMGDMYQDAKQWEPAVANFDKAIVAANASRNAAAKAYALISAATVYEAAGQVAGATPYLRELLSMGPAKGPYEASARKMLKTAVGG